MRKLVPLRICLVCGIVMLIQFFIPHNYSQTFFQYALDWLIVCGVFAVVIGLDSNFRLHLTRIIRRKKGWGYSLITMVAVLSVAFIGIKFGIGADSLFMKIYRNVEVPMDATMFSLLGFFMASASFRAFKAKNKEATVLLIIAVLMMLGRIPIGYFMWDKLPNLVEWIMMYPNMAAQRGILLGVGLGAAAMQLKILLGIERGWLGGAGD
ncbi:MAG: hypothetical protein PHE49_09420 [bacterium]|nr:hypothetical protein [bacterium]